MYAVRKKLKVDLPLSLDYAVSKQTCCTVLKALLKYILYQRQQLPIQLDMLAKEIQIIEPSLDLKDELHIDPDDLSQLDIRTKMRKMMDHRRQVMQKQSYLRRRTRWKVKVNKLLDKFSLIIKTLTDEIQNYRLKEVMFLIGTNPYSAKEMYRVHLPEIYEIDCPSEQATLDRKTLRHMLRTFLASEDLSKVVNSKIPISKVWVMISKSSTATEHQSSQENFLPKTEYSISSRANEVNIHINGADPSVNMELTPVVKGNIYYNSVPSRKELFGQHCTQHGAFYSTYEDLGVTPISDCSNMDVEWVKPLSVDETPLSKRPKGSPEPHRMTRICNSPMQETPVCNRYSGTPSPIKKLSKRFEGITVEEESMVDIWFQMTHSLNGFKEFLPMSNMVAEN